jgi:hypothetical protein
MVRNKIKGKVYVHISADGLEFFRYLGKGKELNYEDFKKLWPKFVEFMKDDPNYKKGKTNWPAGNSVYDVLAYIPNQEGRNKNFDFILDSPDNGWVETEVYEIDTPEQVNKFFQRFSKYLPLLPKIYSKRLDEMTIRLLVRLIFSINWK